MAYEPTTWNCGDTITAEKLNKLENGLAECCGGGTSSEPLILMADRDGFYNHELGRYMTHEDFVEINESGRLIFARFGYTQPLSIVLVDLDSDPVSVHCNLLWFDDYNLMIKASRYALYSNSNLDYREYETSELTPLQ